MARRLSRKSALRLMMVGGGLVAATPAALPQGSITPGDMDRAKFNCFNVRSKNKGANIPCCMVRSKNKGGMVQPQDLKNKAGVVTPSDLQNKAGVITPSDLQNKGQIPSNPCGVRGGVKK